MIMPSKEERPLVECPNCNSLGVKVGVCMSNTCSKTFLNNDYIVYCDECYNEHARTNHNAGLLYLNKHHKINKLGICNV